MTRKGVSEHACNELLEYLLKTKNPPEPLDEAAAYEASSLVSGSFVYNLQRALWLEGRDRPPGKPV